MTGALVDDFPPARARLVTLANWRQAPFSAWSFRNVRRLIPTVNIAASGHMTALELALEEIGHKARRSVSLCLDQYRRARLGVYERACERAYADILSEYLWTPLGAEHDAYITIDARNAMRAAGHLRLTTRPRTLCRDDSPPRRRRRPAGRAGSVDRRHHGQWIYIHPRSRTGHHPDGIRGHAARPRSCARLAARF